MRKLKAAPHPVYECCRRNVTSAKNDTRNLRVVRSLKSVAAGARGDSCHADLRGRARSLSKNKYKRNTADGRRRASHKSARLINTARCNGTSCLLRTRDASVSQYYLNLPFYAFSYGHVPVQ
ncbi:Uncharacterized protein FWK35_00004394 [Aphis craccivora]|uniref:Uncharacterized protein n=1 Tax=Aphis craccivora TaxID=307492 RepID=A0A6G0ZBN5_APHCR|nr:Uncharacterized protein FWK35_00004394 [Aphis craccivora]